MCSPPPEIKRKEKRKEQNRENKKKKKKKRHAMENNCEFSKNGVIINFLNGDFHYHIRETKKTILIFKI